jgi:3',5'-cyclic AMP phosphodiesterase CpdA
MGGAKVSRAGYVLATLLLCACADPGGSGGSFRFAQVSDTHVGDKDGEQRLQDVVAALNALSLPLVCVVHTGDLAEGGASEDAAKGRLAGLRQPLHVLPGNHDITDAAGAQDFVARWGSLSSSAEYQGVIFLFVYDQVVPSLGYDPLAWLEDQLARANSKPVIVFHHEPPVEDFYNNVLHPGWLQDKRERWTRLLEGHQVIADITGHFHRGEQHHLGKVPLLVGEPVSGRFGRQAAYRVYEYENGSLSYRTQFIEPP